MPHNSEKSLPEARNVVYFDGVCNLCNGVVAFLLKADRHKKLKFSSLQSPHAAQQLGPDRTRSLSTIYFQEGDQITSQSDAVIRITTYLPFPWNLGVVLKIFPTGARNYLYEVVAENRYHWFGKRTECAVPEPGWRERFLE